MKLTFLLPAVLLGVATVRAQTVIDLGASQDTSIFASNTSNSDGGGAGLFVGTDSSNRNKRALIEFNFSSIPNGATITNVQLTLTVGMTAGGGTSSSETIGLFDLTDSWGEGTKGSPSQPSSGISGSGIGFAAAAGDATWSSRFFGSTTWTTAGGDHSGTVSANPSSTGSIYVWSSAQMTTDVQNWINTPSTNDGWELINGDESDASTFVAFYSREWGGFTGGNAGQEPQLQVTYSVPEPTAGALAGLALAGLAFLRPIRRRV